MLFYTECMQRSD